MRWLWLAQANHEPAWAPALALHGSLDSPASCVLDARARGTVPRRPCGNPDQGAGVQRGGERKRAPHAQLLAQGTNIMEPTTLPAELVPHIHASGGSPSPSPFSSSLPTEPRGQAERQTGPPALPQRYPHAKRNTHEAGNQQKQNRERAERDRIDCRETKRSLATMSAILATRDFPVRSRSERPGAPRRANTSVRRRTT